jgi:hypothetical protein
LYRQVALGVEGEGQGDRVVVDEGEGGAVALEGRGDVAGLLAALAVLEPRGDAGGDRLVLVGGLAGEGREFVAGAAAGDLGGALGGAADGGAGLGEQLVAAGVIAELLDEDPTCLSGHGRTDSLVVAGGGGGGEDLGEVQPAARGVQRGRGERRGVEVEVDREQRVGEVEQGRGRGARGRGLGRGGAEVDQARGSVHEHEGRGGHAGTSSTSSISSSSSTW